MSGSETAKAVDPGAWAACLPVGRAAALGPLRIERRVTACQQSDRIWLRGSSLPHALTLALQAIPDLRLFQLAEDGQLTPLGARVPVARLPKAVWTPLADWLTVELPTPGLPGHVPDPVPLSIVRSTGDAPADVWLTELGAWQRWAEGAPELRLERLTFAVCADRRVVVRGVPAPPLPGTGFVETAGVAVECGWTWSPPLEPEVVRIALGLRDRDLALWHGDGSGERVPGNLFVRAGRSAARMSGQ